MLKEEIYDKIKSISLKELEILVVRILNKNYSNYKEDKKFKNHPLTFDEELIKLWNNRIPPDDIPNRNLIFANIKAAFLIIGTTILDLEKSE